MLKIRPKLILNRYRDLDIAYFKQKGYQAVLIDLDNTLAPYYAKRIDDDALNFINDLKKAGFKVAVVSNNSKERVGTFLAGYDIAYVYYASKPLLRGYRQALKILNVSSDKTISMGDQLLTDVIGSNRLGMYSIYVKPIVDKDSITTVINRRIEKLLFRFVVK